jgi:geranylgeranyl diphosphate synthase type II
MLKQLLSKKIQTVDKYLNQYIPSEDTKPSTIYESMRYSVFAGGKRLRPILMMGAFEAVGGTGEKVFPFACALEMIHTYSLIHDDLPAMDDDDFRRGKPTNHKVYGEGIAILAGDALLNTAHETMITAAKEYKGEECLEAMDIISSAAGTRGMIGGQVIDLLSENKPIDLDQLHYIHENKTGALIRAAVKAGGVLGKAEKEQIDLLDHFGYCLGMAFQIQDDILDVTSTTAELGKPIQSDVKNGKATYVSLNGLEAAKQYMEKLSYEAINAVERFGEQGAFLKQLTEHLISRTY